MNESYLYEKAKTIYSKYKSCKELQRKISIKTAVSLILTMLWYYIWISSAISYFNKPWATFNIKNLLMYISSFAILIVPFLLFKPQKMLSFKPFIGKICDKKFTYLQFTRNTRQDYTVIMAKELNGRKIRKIKVKSVDGILKQYSNDTPIVCLRGIDYPIKIDIEDQNLKEETLFCPCCGHYNPTRYDRCFECASPIWIK